MEYEDKIQIATGEGIEVEVALAGIGSRMAARLIDFIFIGAMLIAAGLLIGDRNDDSATDVVLVIISVVVGFAVIWFYDTFFEAFNSGRTPGKKALGVRVIDENGGPISFGSAAIRNLLRIIDEGTIFIVGIVSIVRSPRNQRLGDVAGGALVIKDRVLENKLEATIAETDPETTEIAVSRWDTTAVSDEEMALARRFLDRRSTLDKEARKRLALDIERRIRPKVEGVLDTQRDELFIELLVASKARPS